MCLPMGFGQEIAVALFSLPDEVRERHIGATS
jgi:hypothetical protein